MFTREKFGKRLKQLRREHGEKQEDLGEIIGVSKAQISELEKGNKSTTLEKFALICEHYKVSSDYLLGIKDQPEP